MSSGREDGPVYYREIQKNAYLKRIPNDVTGSKLRPLGGKKVPLKAMWTQLCVHNGRTPYLEQYPDAESPATLTHKPVWRACLVTARHVTASVKPHSGEQYDFLVDTDNGAVRMLAPDWESMQDWVTTLRNTLHELKILSKGENVYCSGPAPPAPPPAPRAPARDPTSPLPPTPPTPPDRVPGIELAPTRPTTEAARQPEPISNPPVAENPIEPQVTQEPHENIDISSWDLVNTFTSLPSTSQGSQSRIDSSETKKNLESRKVTKICGQNICLDDSLFNRTASGDDYFDDRMTDDEDDDYKQRVVISNEKDGEASNHQSTNITVIQVSNKEPPHTAIPVMGPETDIFDFDFKQKVTITEPASPNFVNIVNTEQNDYGTTFGAAKNESEYGHLSLTTTVSLSGTNDSNGFNQPTSIVSNQPTSIVSNQATSIVSNQATSIVSNHTTTIDTNLTTSTVNNQPTSIVNNQSTSIVHHQPTSIVNHTNSEEVYERLCMASTSNTKPSPLPVKKLKSVEKVRKSSLPNLEVGDSTYEYLFLSNNNTRTVNVTPEVNCNGDTRVQVNLGSNSDPINRVRSVERSRSQNAYDSAPRTAENRNRRAQNSSPKREIKNENAEVNQPQKPIWKRGLTELSLLTRLRSIGQAKKDSPTRQEDQQERNVSVTSPVKVVHRSRTENRVDSSRRRSSSLSNGQSPIVNTVQNLQSLRVRQAACLRAEQRRGAALVASISIRDAPVFADYDNQVWVSWWGAAAGRASGRCGDRVAAVRGAPPTCAAHAHAILHAHRTAHSVDIHFHRVPLAKIYVITKRDQETIGIKLDNECNIIRVEPNSGADRAGIPPIGQWALTEINNRPINLIKGGEDDMNRLSKNGTEVSILIQPSALVKKLRAALKGHKNLLGLR